MQLASLFTIHAPNLGRLRFVYLQAIPKAKMVSVLVVLGVVAVYNKLIDITGSRDDLKMHHLFYFFGTFYFVIFSGIAYLLTGKVLPFMVSAIFFVERFVTVLTLTWIFHFNH